MEEEPFVHPDFLPAGFGRVGRQAFEEILVGPPTSWSPETPFWAVLGAVLVTLAAYGAYRAWAAYRRNAYRRAAQVELEALRARVAKGEHGAVGELPALLKRCAMAAYGRGSVAALSGDAWLAFLESRANGAGFVDGPGAVIPALVYRGPAAASPDAVPALFTATERWIRGHRA